MVACVAVALAPSCTAYPARSGSLSSGQWVRVLKVATDGSIVVILDQADLDAGARSLGVVAGTARDATKLTAPGDTVRIELSTDGNQVTRLDPVSVVIGGTERVAALVLSAFAVILPVWLLFGRQLRWVIIGEDNRYSASKFQMAVWTLAVLASYLAAIALRGLRGGPFLAGGVVIPANVLWVSGLSAFGFAGAKQIVSSQIRNAPSAAPHLAKTISRTGGRFPRDLVTDDTGQRPDFGDIQMLIVSVLAAGTYVVQVFGRLQILHLSARFELPDIGNTMLGLFGAGQAAYLGKKLAGDTGVNAASGPISSDLPPKPPV
jgi:hypothetical protein